MAKIKKVSIKKRSDLGKTYLKYKVCISGAADLKFAAPGTKEKAIEVGRLVAQAGAVLVTGATTGVPYWEPCRWKV